MVFVAGDRKWHAGRFPTGKSSHPAALAEGVNLIGWRGWRHLFSFCQSSLAFGFAPANLLRTVRWNRPRGCRWLGQAFPRLVRGQVPRIGPQVHILFEGNEHIDAPLFFAPADAFAIEKPAIQNEPLDHTLARFGHELFDQVK